MLNTMTSQIKVVFFLLLLPTLSTADTIEQLTARAKNGDQQAQLELGVTLLQEKQLQEKQLQETNGKTSSATALSYLEPLAMKGNQEAQIWLGRAYRDALAGVNKDSKLAFTYFEKAAGSDGKNPEAQYELATAYYAGDGTDRNLIAAYMWVSLSLGKGSVKDNEARQLQEILTENLNAEQLDKAKLLVKQLETLYIKS